MKAARSTSPLRLSSYQPSIARPSVRVSRDAIRSLIHGPDCLLLRSWCLSFLVSTCWIEVARSE
jgi:hypothetical protein